MADVVPQRFRMIKRFWKPLGKASPGRVALWVPVIFHRLRRGGKQTDESVRRFQLALELNARTVCAFSDAVRDSILPIATEKMLEGLPDLNSDENHEEAMRVLGGGKTVDDHITALKAELGRAADEKQRIDELARYLRIREILKKGLDDAVLVRRRRQKFFHENVYKNREPGQATQLLTFLPFALVDIAINKVKALESLLEQDDALLDKSRVTPHEIQVMAFFAQVNAAYIYLDYYYLNDLARLTIYAGRFALGCRNKLRWREKSAYRVMLCKIGRDRRRAELRPARDGFSIALRKRWASVPGLAEATRQIGRLAKD